MPPTSCRVLNLVFVILVSVNINVLCQFENDHFSGQKVLVTVYLESLCPDSRNFVLRQLKPTMDSVLQDHVILKVIPWGKAQSFNGGSQFSCQHGPRECAGNRALECALADAPRAGPSAVADYLQCAMQAANRNGIQHMYPCSEILSVDPQSTTLCADSSRAVQLQLVSEDLTNRVDHSFVPTITIDGVYRPQEQRRALTNLNGLICDKLNQKGVKICEPEAL